MKKFVFFVPRNHAEAVKEAVFATGAGRIGVYDHCSFEFDGVGQFRPLPGSTPYLGEEGVIERVPEVRVEILCTDSQIAPAIDALKGAHPYEEPAWEVYDVIYSPGQEAP